MSNLQSAKSAIEAELQHARKGMAYYQTRVESLESALAQLDNLNGSNLLQIESGTGEGRRGRRAKVSAGSGQKKLPFTGGDFWINLVTDQPRTSPEILTAAINALDFIPSSEQRKKLAGRMTSAIGGLLREKRIQDHGTGRQRRYFK